MNNILTTTSHILSEVEVQLLLFNIIYNVVFQTHRYVPDYIILATTPAESRQRHH